MKTVRQNKLAAILFILPASLLFFTIIIMPIFMSGYYSFLGWDGINQPTFIGIGNYIELFTSPVAGFPKSLLNALILAVLSVFIQLPLSLGLALVLSRGVKGEKFFVAVFFMPVLISTVVIGQLWLKIYNPEYGIVNVALNSLGLEKYARTWLGEQDTALIAVFIPIIWQYVGYHMLLMYAGIKSIPTEIREAAKVEGATEGQIDRYIIIPMLKPIIKVCVIFAVTGSLKAFDLIYVLTRGGPAKATEVPSTLMVAMIFDRNRYGFGSAIAIMIIALCFFFALAIKRAFGTEED
ncbi:MAG TPA: sugar ABC transporter permease [Clostridium sp.]|uniref:Sugar ABC transporter permease n=2 Tax=Acetivibrio mesophilus TaxID=2487273 RepID=A0A4Q0I202_9FIRM|nr:sugar ABC transporter permease [Acetivibrio mesophilus]ODM27726.1 ABC transporter permease [Clostridium sp. Bc-iso-3]RXE58171.1 sugar ABC transporter permease [Acetivibrio mesophilus]HHV28328.1 sugar ABC transporter permease [Clostridium sp.]